MAVVGNAVDGVILFGEVDLDRITICIQECDAFDVLGIAVLCAVVDLGMADDRIDKLAFGNAATECTISRIKVIFIAEHLVVHDKFTGIAACERCV